MSIGAKRTPSSEGRPEAEAAFVERVRDALEQIEKEEQAAARAAADRGRRERPLTHRFAEKVEAVLFDLPIECVREFGWCVAWITGWLMIPISLLLAAMLVGLVVAPAATADGMEPVFRWFDPDQTPPLVTFFASILGGAAMTATIEVTVLRMLRSRRNR